MKTLATVKIRAVGYDIDGTMVDSEPLHVAAWHNTLARNQRQFSDLPADFRNTMAGRKPLAIATFMVEHLNISISSRAFLAQKHADFMDKVRTDLRPMPGVIASVRRLSEQFRLGIGTSLDRDYAELVLGVLGVSDEFSAIVSGDKITNGKPDPETYLVLAKELGVKPNEMVVLEDAGSGIASAKAAGCWCIAIENVGAEPQDTSQADLVVHSLDEVTNELIRNLEHSIQAQ